MKDSDFEIILSKNRIARAIKRTILEDSESYVSIFIETIKFDFDEIEKKTGVANQPTARDILETEMNI